MIPVIAPASLFNSLMGNPFVGVVAVWKRHSKPALGLPAFFSPLASPAWWFPGICAGFFLCCCSQLLTVAVNTSSCLGWGES